MERLSHHQSIVKVANVEVLILDTWQGMVEIHSIQTCAPLRLRKDSLPKASRFALLHNMGFALL